MKEAANDVVEVMRASPVQIARVVKKENVVAKIDISNVTGSSGITSHYSGVLEKRWEINRISQLGRHEHYS